MNPLAYLKERQNIVFYLLLLCCFYGLYEEYTEGYIKLINKYQTTDIIFGEYLGDRLINASIIKNFKEYGLNFTDPINRTTPIFYQFFFHGLVAKLSNLFNTTVWQQLLFIQLLVTPIFFIFIYWLSQFFLKSRYLSLIVSIIVFFSAGLQGVIPGTEYSASYAGHAVIMDFYRHLFGPYFDTYGMLFGYGAIAVWVHILCRPSHKLILKVLAFVILMTFTILTHYLSALFFLLCMFLTYLCYSYVKIETLRIKKAYWFLFIGVLFHLALLFIYKFIIPMKLLIALGGYFILCGFYFGKTKKELSILIISLLPTFVFVAYNLYIVSSAGSSFSGYNDQVRQKDLSVPFWVVMECYFPYYLGSLLFVILEKNKITRSVGIGLFLATIVGVFNHYFGYNNHPYRFIAYSHPVLILLTGIALIKIYNLLRESKKYLSSYIFATIFIILISMNARYTSVKLGELFANSSVTNPDLLQISKEVEQIHLQNPNQYIALHGTHPVFIAYKTKAKFYYRVHSINPNATEFKDGEFLSSGKISSVKELKDFLNENSLPISMYITTVELEENTPDKPFLYKHIGNFYLYKTNQLKESI